MISLEDFHLDFLQSILSDTESRGLMKPQAFFENVCEELVSSGDLTNNYAVAEYVKKGMEIHGYDYDEERKVLSLLVHQFFQEDEIQTLTMQNITTKFNRLKKFYLQSSSGFYHELEETAPEYSVAYNIYDYKQKKQIDVVRFILLTDGKLTRNLNELPNEEIDGVEAEYRVIDIEYIYKIYLSEFDHNKLEIEVKLPYLEIQTTSDEYKSYLSVISGPLLVQIYEKFGQKLFEQNVRTFLQFKGNVNKGIRNTIENIPEMFFAYNNGITATAENIDLDSEGNITRIVNFQIVNGGQTTSAIYAAWKNSKIDVSKVSVQMKLSVVKKFEIQNDFVSKVSEYANTQNKVNKSDFFSNSPFHKEMKNYSQRIWVSASGGSQRRTHWFYERARGEYLNEQAYLSSSSKKQFQLENPKQQLIDKTLLAKSETVWNQRPNIASKGAQYSFSDFADSITKILENDNLAINEKYFKDAASRVILFKAVEKMISDASWYNGGFRAQTVAYTISYLSYLVEKTGRFLNFNAIWEKQCIQNELADILKMITKSIYDQITTPPPGDANIAQWCKKLNCWEKVKLLDLNIDIDECLLVDKDEQKYHKREEKKIKKLESGIEIQSFVVKTPLETWLNLYTYYLKYASTSVISSTQLDILKKMSMGSLIPPSEKQSKILYQLFEKAQNEGLTI